MPATRAVKKGVLQQVVDSQDTMSAGTLQTQVSRRSGRQTADADAALCRAVKSWRCAALGYVYGPGFGALRPFCGDEPQLLCEYNGLADNGGHTRGKEYLADGAGRAVVRPVGVVVGVLGRLRVFAVAVF
jgi:hypothetical protein